MFEIATGVLQGDPLTPFLFRICLDYCQRIAISSNDGLTLKKRRSRRHPATKLSDFGYADDIALFENHIVSAKDLLNRVESACQEVGLHLNASKTKHMHLTETPTETILISLDDIQIERVSGIDYLGCFTDTDKDIKSKIHRAWSALHSLKKVWKSQIRKETKTKVFKATVESILLYGSESWTLNVARTKRLNGTYTRMLRTVYNILWQSHTRNSVLYGSLPPISSVVKSRCYALAGHVARNDEAANKVVLWSPEERRSS